VAAFQLLRHRRNEPKAFLFAFGLLELDGTDLRREPIEVRKATLASLSPLPSRRADASRSERMPRASTQGAPGGALRPCQRITDKQPTVRAGNPVRLRGAVAVLGVSIPSSAAQAISPVHMDNCPTFR
jgi:hypothetical protein